LELKGEKYGYKTISENQEADCMQWEKESEVYTVAAFSQSSSNILLS